MRIKYTTETQTYSAPNDLDIDSQCIDILFLNSATGTIYINGFPVPTGQTYAITGNDNELNVTKYKVSFAGATGSVIVTRRKYA